jgi:hypothetical protein
MLKTHQDLLSGQDILSLHIPSLEELEGPELHRQLNRDAAVRSMRYASCSEYACTTVLSQFCDYLPVAGENFQVQFPGSAKVFDWALKGAIVEYHPITLSHEFESHGAYDRVLNVARRMPQGEREKLFDALTEEAERRYVRERREAIAHVFSVERERPEVIVAFSPEDFYRKVVRRFAKDRRDLPDIREFEREFKRLCHRAPRCRRG